MTSVLEETQAPDGAVLLQAVREQMAARFAEAFDRMPIAVTRDELSAETDETPPQATFQPSHPSARR